MHDIGPFTDIADQILELVAPRRPGEFPPIRRIVRRPFHPHTSFETCRVVVQGGDVAENVLGEELGRGGRPRDGEGRRGTRPARGSVLRRHVVDQYHYNA